MGGRKSEPAERMPVDRSLDADLCLGAEELNGPGRQLDPKEAPKTADKESATGQGVAWPVAPYENVVWRPRADLSTQFVIRTP